MKNIKWENYLLVNRKACKDNNKSEQNYYMGHIFNIGKIIKGEIYG